MAILLKPSVDPAEVWIELFAKMAPLEEVRVWPAVGAAEDIEFALVRRPPPGAFDACPRLRFVASIPAGVEPLLEPGVIPAAVPITRCVSAVRGEEMAEYVLLQALRFHRQLPAYETQVRWQKLPQPQTSERRVGVMGLGELGAPVARRLAAAGFDTAGWSRTPRTLDATSGRVRNFHGRGSGGLGAFLARTDILVCVLPLTAATRGIIDAQTLRTLPRGSYVINVSRGAHVVEPDLVAAIDAGHLAGACLDVLSIEPPPPELPVVNHPRIYVTPHIACRSRAEHLMPGVLENMRRARAGAPLLHQVDRDAGY